MPGEQIGPERLTAEGIPPARRGYDRKAVEALLEQARRSWSALTDEHDRLLQEIDRAGGLDYLARDLSEVGSEIGLVLRQAQEAAESLRTRARVDSEKRLAAAEAEGLRILADAEEQSRKLRGDSWEAGSELLRQVALAHEARVGETETEVLAKRAGAEQEAYRMVLAAQREAQEIVRTARFEVERALTEAKDHADRMVADARSTVGAHGGLPADLLPARPKPMEGAHVVEKPGSKSGLPNDYTIRLLPPKPTPAAEVGVDPASYADAMAAEVEALWESGEVQVVEPPPRFVWAPAPTVPRAVPSPAAEKPLVSEAAPVEAVAVATPAVQPAAAEPVVLPPVPQPVPVPAPNPVADLFARLRKVVPQPQGAAQQSLTRRPVDEEEEESVLPRRKPQPAAPDPLEVRERLLLPIQNRALREIKQRIVDLQNVALDALRTSGKWGEAKDAVLDAFGPILDRSIEQAAEAGAQAAAALTGSEPPAPLIAARSAVLTGDMAGALAEQVGTAAVAARSAGPLESSATVARVFRAWRTDDAERWVRTITFAAYHDSLLAGLVVAGVKQVMPVAHGALCPDCPAADGRGWDPAGEPPAGTRRPPARPDCSCTVAPATRGRARP
jgi:cell division septum initiation protein DivIVA